MQMHCHLIYANPNANRNHFHFNACKQKFHCVHLILFAAVAAIDQSSATGRSFECFYRLPSIVDIAHSHGNMYAHMNGFQTSLCIVSFRTENRARGFFVILPGQNMIIYVCQSCSFRCYWPNRNENNGIKRRRR